MSGHRTRSVLAAAGLLAVAITPFAGAATGDALREGVRNGTTSKETEIIGDLRSSTGSKGGYVTRQSNLSSSGGGAIYGCRSAEGGSAATPRPQNPCVRANNLSTGLAFEFNATGGPLAGLITVGEGGDTKSPFATNATGVAVGLNADRVDGKHADQIIAEAKASADALGGTPADEIKNETQPFSFRLAAGATKVIAEHGPLKMTASCTINDGGTDTAKVASTTTVDNAAGESDSSSDPDVDTGEELASTEAAPTGTPFIGEIENGIIAPNGQMIMAAENGILIGGNLHGQPGTCYFAGSVVVSDSTG